MHRMSDDSGAVTVLVALLLPVVLLGMGALVLDFGQLYAEKRQLQNGADAGALALAREYAQEAPVAQTCVAGARLATAESYADDNANDAAGSNVVSIQCPAANKVRVTTSTNSSDGGFLAPILAQVLGAGPATLEAEAAAAWGPPAAGSSALPITISDCEFSHFTSNATAFAPSPPYPPYPAGFERVVQFHGQNPATPCPAQPSGADLPGGFGWLDTNQDCQATTETADWFPDDPGSSPPSSCDPSDLRAMLGKILHIPVFDATNGLNGNNGEYHIKGYAAFVLTGYWFTGQFREESVVTNTNLCSGAQRCLYGFFTKDLTPTAGVVGTGPSLGVTVLQLTD